MEVKAVRVETIEELKNPGNFILEGLYPPTNLRELTEDEHKQYDRFGYDKYEEYAKKEGAVVGKFWTKEELELVANGPIVVAITFICPCGCGSHGRIQFMRSNQPKWNWNGDKDNPTCTPSIQRLDGCRWHGYLTDGIFKSV